MWDFGVLTACYLYNRNPTKILHGKSPLKVLFKRSPEYSKLRVFSCKCFPCLCPNRANKLDVKSLLCIFVGYSVQQDAYLYLGPGSCRIFPSRDVTFDEEHFSLNSIFSEGSVYNWNFQLGQKFLGIGLYHKLLEPDHMPNETDRVNMQLPPVASEKSSPD